MSKEKEAYWNPRVGKFTDPVRREEAKMCWRFSRYSGDLDKLLSVVRTLTEQEVKEIYEKSRSENPDIWIGSYLQETGERDEKERVRSAAMMGASFPKIAKFVKYLEIDEARKTYVEVSADYSDNCFTNGIVERVSFRRGRERGQLDAIKALLYLIINPGKNPQRVAEECGVQIETARFAKACCVAKEDFIDTSTLFGGESPKRIEYTGDYYGDVNDVDIRMKEEFLGRLDGLIERAEGAAIWEKFKAGATLEDVVKGLIFVSEEDADLAYTWVKNFLPKPENGEKEEEE